MASTETELANHAEDGELSQRRDESLDRLQRLERDVAAVMELDARARGQVQRGGDWRDVPDVACLALEHVFSGAHEASGLPRLGTGSRFFRDYDESMYKSNADMLRADYRALMTVWQGRRAE